MIEEAEAKGDDLAVIPESFKPAAEARSQGLTQRRTLGLTLQPEDNIDGRFAAPERLPDGFYSQTNESMGTLPEFVPRNPNAPHIPLHPRASFDSMASGFTGSPGNSVYMPRRVESIMGDEDRRKYFVAQANQREAGGAYMEEPRGGYNEIYGYKNGMDSSDSINSAGSYFAANASRQEGYNLQNYSLSKEEFSGSSSPDISTEASKLDTAPEGDIARLQLPEAVHSNPQGRGRPSNAVRSPLARNSLVRTATGEESHPDLQVLEGPATESNNGEDFDLDNKSEKKQRNKLTKPRS